MCKLLYIYIDNDLPQAEYIVIHCITGAEKKAFIKRSASV